MELPPPRPGFGLQREMDEHINSDTKPTSSAPKGKAIGRDPGLRRVSFDTGERTPLAGGRGTSQDDARSEPTSAPQPYAVGLQPQLTTSESPTAATSAWNASATPSASTLDLDAYATHGAGTQSQPHPTPHFTLPAPTAATATTTSTPVASPGATTATATGGTTAGAGAPGSSEGGSDLSLSLNASMRRTKRRQAAAAAAAAFTAAPAAGPIGAAAPPAVTSQGLPGPGPGYPTAAAAAPATNGSGASSGAVPSAPATPPAAELPTGPFGPSPTDTGSAVLGATGEQGYAASPPGPPPPPPVYGPLYTKPIPPNVLAVTVERTEALRHDPLLTNPVVRLHILDPVTGEYLASLDDPSLGPLDPVRQSELLEYPGRPTLMTSGNSTAAPAPAVLRALPPVQTQPYDLLSRPEARTLAAWEETLLVDEAVERLLALDPLLLFEVLQLPVSYARYRKHVRAFEPSDGAHLVAWGFLRPAGPPPGSLAPSPSPSPFPPAVGGPLARQPLLGRLKLQLYEYARDATTAVRASVGGGGASAGVVNVPGGGGGGAGGLLGALSLSSPGGGPGAGPVTSPLNAGSRAFLSWRALMGAGGPAAVAKYPSALTVVLQAVPRPEPEVVVTEPERGVRPFLPAGYGSGFETSKVPLSAYLRSGAGPDGLGGLGGPEGAGEDVTRHPLYRPITEPCKIPNSHYRTLGGGPCGVSALAFSSGGTYLAAAAAGGAAAGQAAAPGAAGESFRILIYKSLTGALVKTIPCAHNGFVYELAWARDDSALISASADCTAKIWELNPVAAAAAMDAAEAAVAAAAEAAAADGTAAAGGASGGGAAASAAAADAAAAAAAAAPAMSLLATMKPRAAAAAAPSASAAPTAPGTPNATLNLSRRTTATAMAALGATARSSAAAAAAAVTASGLPHPTLLCHACYVYSAAFHPAQRPGCALVATGAYDGTVRLWRRYTGELLAAVKTQAGAINSLCFDKLGTRLYAGDSAGVLQEFSCDVSRGAEAVAAAPGATNLKASTITSGGAGGSSLNATLAAAAAGSSLRGRMTASLLQPRGGGGGAGAVNLNASMLPRAALNASMRTPTASTGGDGGGGGPLNASSTAARPATAPPSGGGGGALNATGGSTAAAAGAGGGGGEGGAPAAANILRVLRQCDEFDGEPLSHVFLHPSGRRLGVLTKRSRLLVLETRGLSRAETFLGLRSREAPLRAAFSPDGRYLVCGSEDGRVVGWHADGGPPSLLPAWELGGDTVVQVAWNPVFQLAAVGSFASWAPLLLLAHDPRVGEVALAPGPRNTVELAGQRERKQAEAASLRPRWDIPDRLTPDFLRLMLADIRRDAGERGILTANDPNGDHLVVPYNRLEQLRSGGGGHGGGGAAAANATGGSGGGSKNASTKRLRSKAGAAGADAETPPTPSAHGPAAGALDSLVGGLPGSRFPAADAAAAISARSDAQAAVARELLARSMGHSGGSVGGGGGTGRSGGSGGSTGGTGGLAISLPPPAFKDPPPPPQLQPSGPAPPPPPQQQLQEYQWAHPQPQPQPRAPVAHAPQAPWPQQAQAAAPQPWPYAPQQAQQAQQPQRPQSWVSAGVVGQPQPGSMGAHPQQPPQQGGSWVQPEAHLRAPPQSAVASSPPPPQQQQQYMQAQQSQLLYQQQQQQQAFVYQQHQQQQQQQQPHPGSGQPYPYGQQQQQQQQQSYYPYPAPYAQAQQPQPQSQPIPQPLPLGMQQQQQPRQFQAQYGHPLQQQPYGHSMQQQSYGPPYPYGQQQPQYVRAPAAAAAAAGGQQPWQRAY